jgi:hypothetical protein
VRFDPLRSLVALTLLLLAVPAGAEDQFAPGAPHAIYCVRACDGYFWRQGTAKPEAFPAEEESCPAAEVDLFVYRTEDESELHLRSRIGKPYGATGNAWTFRRRVVPDCGCR